MTRIHDRLRVEISPDGLQASLVPVRRHPRGEVRVRQVLALLRDRGVLEGLDSDRIGAFLAAWKGGRADESWVVAQGIPARARRSRDFERLPPPVRSGQDPVQLLPLYVHAGEPVIEVREMVPPAPGCSVRGRVIPAPPGLEDPRLEPGDGLVVEGARWVAGRTGFLQLEGGRVTVSETLLHLHDLPAGEYRWPGGAQIAGSLLPGVRLHLGGSLELGGDVEAGVTVHTQGNLAVGGNVGGEGQTHLQSEGRLHCLSAEAATLVAYGDIEIAVTCRACQVRTLGHFRMLGEGRLEGTRVEALQGAAVHDVAGDGSASSITVGTTEWLDAELGNLEEEIRRWTRHHARLFEEFHARYEDLLENRSEIHRLPPDERQRFEEAQAQVTAGQERVDWTISSLRTRQSTIAAQRQLDPNAVIRIDGHAAPSTSCTVRRRSYRVRAVGLDGVVLRLAPGGGRLIAVPRLIHDASQSDLEQVSAP